MPVDSERKSYGPRLTSSQMSWLATQSMRAYSWWMCWLHESDPNLQQTVKDNTPEECRALIGKAYRRK
jgi:hypothetical protein